MLKHMQRNLQKFFLVNLRMGDDTSCMPRIRMLYDDALLLPIETCARHLFIGFDTATLGDKVNAAISSLPEQASPDKSFILKGEAAYSYLLRFCVGLESQKVAEYKVSNHLISAWAKFMELNSPNGQLSENARAFRPLVDAAIADSRQIRVLHVEGRFKSPSKITIAKTLANAQKGDTALVIDGHPSLTVNTLLSLSRADDRQAGKILIVHDNKSTTMDSVLKVKRLIASGSSFPEIVPCSIFDLSTLTSQGNIGTAYVCQPIDNSRYDRSAYQICSFFVKTAVHLHGALPEAKITGQWRRPNGFNLIGPQELNRLQESAIYSNETVISNAATACQIAAKARAAGYMGDRVALAIQSIEAKDGAVGRLSRRDTNNIRARS